MLDTQVLLSTGVRLPWQTGSPCAPDRMDRQWKSGFFTAPIAGPTRLGRTNLDGDRQANLKVHGGRDTVVLAHAAAHYPAWREELDRLDLPCGAFGENLTISGLDEASVCIDDTYQVGEPKATTHHERNGLIRPPTRRARPAGQQVLQ